jgi:hypothetical protein
LHALNLGCRFITLREPCYNQRSRCDIACYKSFIPRFSEWNSWTVKRKSFVNHCLCFVFFSFRHCIVCSSLIYGFLLTFRNFKLFIDPLYRESSKNHTIFVDMLYKKHSIRSSTVLLLFLHTFLAVLSYYLFAIKYYLTKGNESDKNLININHTHSILISVSLKHIWKVHFVCSIFKWYTLLNGMIVFKITKISRKHIMTFQSWSITNYHYKRRLF